MPKKQTVIAGKKEWFNKRCEAVRRTKEDTWKKWRKSKRINLWNNYKQARNYYVKILRDDQRQFEKDIIDRYKN